jgi:DNA-binding CsgD family transcriptional regulator
MVKAVTPMARLSLPFDANIAQKLAQAIQSIGQPDFEERLFALVSVWMAFDTFGVTQFFADQVPQQSFISLDRSLSQVDDSVYYLGAYVLDPFYLLFKSKAPSGVYRLFDIAPDGFETSEYFRMFHGPSGAGDELNFLIRGKDGNATAVFIERLASKGSFTTSDLVTAELVGPVVLSLVEQHSQKAVPITAPKEDVQTHVRVENALRNFGRSRLTDREREVLIYALRGFSPSLTAQTLQVAEGTVKNHRKAIYRKLDVGSQADLFSLFIHAIPFASSSADDENDPLAAYEKPAAKMV